MFAAGDGEDSGRGGTSTSHAYVVVNGGPVSLGTAEDSVTDIVSDNVTVHIDENYNPIYLYKPRVTELHMVNNVNGALWNPTLEELPTTLHAAVMKQAKVALLYDGWVDLENVGSSKPAGATRAGEILGYDIYAKMGEQYAAEEEIVDYPSGARSYPYSDGGIYTAADKVNYTWAMVQLYRAIGIEQTQLYVLTAPHTDVNTPYDINSSPIAQFITMATSGVDTSAIYSYVAATRTDPELYSEIAKIDGFGALPLDSEEHLTVGEFCVLAYNLMTLYGEPVLTERETYLLLEAFGRELPYGLSPIQLEAVKYLLARGVVETAMDWRSDITFDEAVTILMRIKDKESRLTFKEIQLTTDMNLLSKGYYPTEVVSIQSPVEVVNSFTDYGTYTAYDYFVEVIDTLRFRNAVMPFICAGSSNEAGPLDGTQYMGCVAVDGKSFYHFRAGQRLPTVASGDGAVYINTVLSTDAPASYKMPAPGDGNVGGYWLCTGLPAEEVTSGSVCDQWEWFTLDGGNIEFPSEYCDKARKAASIQTYTAQLSGSHETSYGFAIRIHDDDLSKVRYNDTNMTLQPLSNVVGAAWVEAVNNIKIRRELKAGATPYTSFTVIGCNSKQTLSEVLVVSDTDVSAYQTFPAFTKDNDRYLVSVDYLKAIGAIWDFTQVSDCSYYLGVQTTATDYTDVYIGTGGKSVYVIRGTQLTLYPEERVIVYEKNNLFYVDYGAVLGIQRVVSLESNAGAVTLSRANQAPFLKRRQLHNVNNVVDTVRSTYNYLQTVSVTDRSGNQGTYIYAPATYALANWLVVDNKVDNRSGVFSFYASDEADSKSSGAAELRSMLGIETSNTKWRVSYVDAPPIDGTTVTVAGDGTLTYSKAGALPDILYIQSLNAYLLKPYCLKSTKTYGEWVDDVSGGNIVPITSIISKYAPNDPLFQSGYIADWNYNLYNQSPAGCTLHLCTNEDGTFRSKLCNMSEWIGDTTSLHSNACFGDDYEQSQWAPAAAGIPGLVGYPYANSAQISSLSSTDTYSGIAYVRRGGEGTGISLKTVQGVDGETAIRNYAVMHITPNKAWLQSCGFVFTFLETSPMSTGITGRPIISTEGAEAAFDWDGFFRDVGLQNADDWLTIAIIAVLNILPRVFMFLFILLMGLSLIANVKPWQVFCDNVFDPYKLLTLGRKDVHTVQLKMVLLYSIIALALFGLFQNGTILNVIAWIARAITGILSR